jgi:hypothetical protein
MDSRADSPKPTAHDDYLLVLQHRRPVYTDVSEIKGAGSVSV